MAWFGTVFNIAKVGIGMLNGILNKTGSAVEVTGEDGNLIALHSHYVVRSIDRSLEDTVLAASSGFPVGTVTLSLTSTQDPTHAAKGSLAKPSYKILAFNTDKTKAYRLDFALTDPNGQPTTSNVIIPKFSPAHPAPGVDVTDYIQGLSSGNGVCTPVTLDATTAFGVPVEIHGDEFLALGTVLTNVFISTITLGGAISLFKSTEGELTLTWNNVSGAFAGINVTSTLPWDITITVNATVKSPLTSSTLAFTFKRGSAVGNFPGGPITRPINSASISAVTASPGALDSVLALTDKTRLVHIRHSDFSKLLRG